MINEFLNLKRLSSEDPVEVDNWEEIHPSELSKINPLSVDKQGRDFYQFIFPYFVDHIKNNLNVDDINIAASLWRKKVPFEGNYDLWSSISNSLEDIGITNENIISGYWFIEMTKSKKDLMMLRRCTLTNFIRKCTPDLVANLNNMEFFDCLNIFIELSKNIGETPELPISIYNSIHLRQDYASSITAALIEFYKNESFAIYPELFLDNYFIIAPCFENNISIPHNFLYHNIYPELPFIIIDTGDSNFAEKAIQVIESFNPLYQNENGETPLMAFIKKFGKLPSTDVMNYEEEITDKSNNTWKDLISYVSIQKGCDHVEEYDHYIDGKLYCEDCAPPKSKLIYYDGRCPICYEEFNIHSEFVVTKCNHIYCKKCGLASRLKCPQCGI